MSTEGKRQFVDAEGNLVPEGSSDARFLVAGANDEVDQALIDRLKAEANGPVAVAHEGSGVTIEKEADKPADKAVKKSDNK